MNTGILYGVGVGPGDPELLTFQAARVLREADVIAVPASDASRQVALDIVQAHVQGKTLLPCETPMVRDKKKLAENYDRVADEICAQLEAGRSVAFITLGDPTIYSTYLYIHRRVRKRGYKTQIISGIPSFCAVAAKLDMPLCEGSEMLHIIPASHESTEEGLALSGSKVLMKAGKAICDVRDKLAAQGKLGQAAMVECCGMPEEKVYHTLAQLDGEASYFSVIIVKEEEI